jgi:hypothetical protein
LIADQSRQSCKPQCQLPIAAFVSLDKVLNAGRQFPRLQITAAPELLGNIFRNVLRPFFCGVEGYDADRVVILTI